MLPYLHRKKQRSHSSLFSRTPASERGLAYVDPRVFDSPDQEAEDEEDEEYETSDRLVPRSWVLVGLGASGALGVGIIWALFGADTIKPWATAVGFVLACLLSLLGYVFRCGFIFVFCSDGLEFRVRALGETDLNPVSGIGKISQLLFAVLQPHSVVANIIAGAVAEAGAQQAGDLMQDLKTGALLNASPRQVHHPQRTLIID